MGANAQTTVPKYTALTVLPAASMNISAGTGIPVFASTVTRDAAFGGANKVLAEGQTCYLESTNVVQYYDGAAWASVGPAAVVLQVVTAKTATTVSTSSTSYVTTGLSASITPTSAASRVMIQVTATGQSPPVFNNCRFTLFRGTVAGTNLATNATPGFTNVYSPSAQVAIAINYIDSPATTSATTYTLGFNVAAQTGSVNPNTETATMILTELSA